MTRQHLKMNKYVLYSYLLSLLQARMARVVTYKQFMQTLRRNRIYDTLSDIEGSILGEYLSQRLTPETNLYEAEALLWGHLESEINLLSTIGLKDLNAFVNSYITKYDVKNIVYTVRGLVFNTKPSQLIPLGTLRKQDLIEKLNKIENVDDLIDLLRKASLHAYARIIYNRKESIQAKDYKVLGIIEAELYRKYLLDLFTITKKIKKGGHFLRRAVQILIDVYNIVYVLRSVMLGLDRRIAEQILIEDTLKIPLSILKEALSQESIDRVIQLISSTPYHSLAEKLNNALSSNLPESFIEVIVLDWVVKEIHLNLLSTPLSIQVVFDYLLHKEREISLMRLVYWCIWNNIPREMLEKYIAILGD